MTTLKKRKFYKRFRKTQSKNNCGYLGGKRKTLKKRKSNKSNKRFRKTQTKKQKGGDETQEEKLLRGARLENLIMVKEALDAGADMNAKDEDGWTAIAIASQVGSIEIVAKLLEKGADVNTKTNDDNTALISASYKGYKDIVEKLLKAGAEVNAKNIYGKTALISASEQGHTDTMAILEEAIANNTPTISLDETLVNAARDKKLDKVINALENGADVNAKGEATGYTALIWASEKGNTDIVKKLLEKGADVNVKGSRLDYTALMRASTMGHKDIVKMLLKKEGIDVNAMDGIERTALSEAIRKNEEASRTNNNNSYKDIIAMLENAIANNTENNSSEETQEETQKEKDTKLINAAIDNELDNVKKALDAGADVNATDEDGDTALILASVNGYTDIVEELLENEADVNTTDGEGETALIVASLKGYTDIVVMLLAAGADVNTKTNDGWTALISASEKGHTKIVKLLKKAMGIKEENFIVDKFCKEATYATYLDVIEGEITRDIQEYLSEDKDNIMLIYKSNKADTDLEYFGTTRTIITNAFKDKLNLFFGCNKIAEFARVPPESEYNKNDIYFKLSKIGLVGTSSEYCDIKELLENEEHQLFAIKSLNTNYPSFVSHNVLYGEDRRRLVSASHCQGGDAASVSMLIKAYPKNEEFPEISNSNMLQETTSTEPFPPPPPAVIQDSDQEVGFGGKRRTKRKTKRKSKKTKKSKRKTIRH